MRKIEWAPCPPKGSVEIRVASLGKCPAGHPSFILEDGAVLRPRYYRPLCPESCLGFSSMHALNTMSPAVPFSFWGKPEAALPHHKGFRILSGPCTLPWETSASPLILD